MVDLRPEWCGEGGRKRWKTREECGYIGLCLIAWPTAAGPRDAASRIGSGGHGHVFFWASVSLAGGRFERCNSLVLLALLYRWHADDASELRPRSGTRGRSIKRIRGRSGGAATSLTV